jgi:hypothetical protein
VTTSIGPVSVRTGSAIRGAGVALACLVPGVAKRAEVIAATYTAAWPVDRPGIQMVVVVPDEDDEPWKQKVLPLATSGLSWTALMLLGTLAVRRSPLPAPVGALLLGAGVVAADSALADVFARLKERALSAADQATDGLDDATPAVAVAVAVAEEPPGDAPAEL